MFLPLSIELIPIYLVACGVAAFFGRRRRIGYWGFFFLSILVTPVLTALFIFAAAPVKKPRRPIPKRS